MARGQGTRAGLGWHELTLAPNPDPGASHVARLVSFITGRRAFGFGPSAGPLCLLWRSLPYAYYLPARVMRAREPRSPLSFVLFMSRGVKLRLYYPLVKLSILQYKSIYLSNPLRSST